MNVKYIVHVHITVELKAYSVVFIIITIIIWGIVCGSSGFVISLTCFIRCKPQT